MSPRLMLPLLLGLCVGSADLRGQGFDRSLFEEQSQPTAARNDGDKQLVRASAHFSGGRDGQPLTLTIEAQIAEPYYIYSITQPAGGPLATEIEIEKSDRFEVSGPFQAKTQPEVGQDPLFDNMLVEKHRKQAVWQAPLRLAEGVAPGEVTIKGKLTYQACTKSNCFPPRPVQFTASYQQAPASAGSVGSFQAKRAKNTTIRGHLEPQQATPGGRVTLTLVGEPNLAENYHLYGLANRDPKSGPKPTLIVLSETAGWKASAIEAKPTPKTKFDEAFQQEVDYYQGTVTWTIDLQVPQDAKPGDYLLGGSIAYAACADGIGCDPPAAARFQATVTIGDSPQPGEVPLAFEAVNYPAVAKMAEASSGKKLQPKVNEAKSNSIVWILALAFVGGIILNVMPCVLPVIGLKILSFVEQSGQHRSRVFMLNLWYSLGLMSVFMLLATLAVVLNATWGINFKWGQQFQHPEFAITLAAVVFAMGLSFLGVWEIPIPGFATTGEANKLAQQEGALGAFAKGVLTTVLATPCSAPLLGVVFTVALASPGAITYGLFGAIGLGMASPYLVIGAFPRLVRFLPKPGNWMKTFKEIMGFLLMGTVVYLISLINDDLIVPTAALLCGVGLACWWIGRVPGYEDLWVRLRAWAVGGAVTCLAVAFSFGYLTSESDHKLPWEEFSRAKLEQHLAEGKTVMVDFTADWCPNCKYVEATVLNTQPSYQAVKDLKIVPMVADWTEPNEEIAAMLEELDSNSIPVLAIFPADNPDEPIVLRDVYTQQTYLEKLSQASGTPPAAKTAMKPNHR